MGFNFCRGAQEAAAVIERGRSCGPKKLVGIVVAGGGGAEERAGGAFAVGSGRDELETGFSGEANPPTMGKPGAAAGQALYRGQCVDAADVLECGEYGKLHLGIPAAHG